MHTLGKVLTWLILPLALVGVVLTARFLDVQNSWTRRVEQLKQQNASQAQTLEQKREQLQQLKEDMAIASMGWKGYWVRSRGQGNQPVAVRVVNRQTGELAANVGKVDGIVEQTATDDAGNQVTFLPMLHAFRPDPAAPGEYLYVGAFQVQDLRENQIFSMVPTWELKAGEVDSWANTNGWHLRAEIPLDAQTKIDDTLADIITNVRMLQANQRNLAAQQEFLDNANEQLAYRRGQLVGPADPPTEPTLNVEFVKGLVPAIEEVEERRNAAQLEVDRLRRLVKAATDRLERLNRVNELLAESLSKPASEANTAVSAR